MSEQTFEELAGKVRQWASDRQILQNSTAEAQLQKLEEELGETYAALTAVELYHFGSAEDLRDGYGDMLVCVINSMAIAGVDPVEALAHAYGEIKDRTGTLGADGIFYKDA